MTETKISLSPSNWARNSTMVIGVTGSGKSRLVATHIRYVWETFGKATHYYSCDPGGFPSEIQALANRGLCRIFRMRTRGSDLSFETCQLSSKGYWPAQINPTTGDVVAGVRMVPPYTAYYTLHCMGCGHQAKRSVVQKQLEGQLVCPQCKQMISAANRKITRQIQVTKGFEDVGSLAFESAWSICEWGLLDLSKKVDLGGEMGALGGVVQSGGEQFRSNNRAQVGFVQSRIYEFITNAESVPGLAYPPIWTSQSDEGMDEGFSIVGPKFAGSAKTASGPGWFGNCVEMAKVKSDNYDGQECFRLYLSQFYDDQNRRHLLKHRGDPSSIPPYLEDPPLVQGEPGTINSQCNLGLLYQMLEESTQRADASIAEAYPEQQPIPTGTILSFGEEEQAAAQAPTTTPTTGRSVRRTKTAAPTAPAVSEPAEAQATTPAQASATPQDAPEVAQAPAPAPPAVAKAPSRPRLVRRAQATAPVQAALPTEPTPEAETPVPVQAAPIAPGGTPAVLPPSSPRVPGRAPRVPPRPPGIVRPAPRPQGPAS